MSDKIDYMIEVMQAYKRGEQLQMYSALKGTWEDLEDPSWSWNLVDYRIKPKTGPSIDWDDVHKDYNYLTQDSNGTASLWTQKPELNEGFWDFSGDGFCVLADAFASLSLGDDQTILCIRPGKE